MVEGRRGRGRRWDLAFAVAAVLLMAAPASAASGATRSAQAFWDLDDAQRTMVSLQGYAAANDEEPGSLFLFVTQAYCDTTTDEMVFRSFFGQQPLDPASLRVHPLLKSARLTTSTTVTGSEQRLSSCAEPSGIPTFTNLGASTVDVAATWTATGPAHEVQPGFTARDAVATGSITGSTLSLAPLGESDSAQLRSQTMQ